MAGWRVFGENQSVAAADAMPDDIGSAASEALHKRRAKKARIYIGLGLSSLLLGILWPVTQIILHNPWLVLIGAGITLCLLGGVALVLEQGVAEWLPGGLQRALSMSLLEHMMAVRATLNKARNPSDSPEASADGGVFFLAQLSRLAAVCWMDLDDELVREFVTELDPAFRASATAPIVSNLPHPLMQQVLLGRAGLARMQDELRARTRASTVTSPSSPGSMALRWASRMDCAPC